jgi:hypothetical protein
MTLYNFLKPSFRANVAHVVGLILLGVFLHSCKDPVVATPNNPVVDERWDTVTNFNGLIVPQTGKLNFKVNYSFDGQPIVFNSRKYINAANDTFTIAEIRHYFTNVTLVKANGDRVNLQNYHLMDANVANSRSITIDNVPPGNYVGMTILLGVDSMKNHSGLQEGALDPAWSMFWTWNTGYIFYRINGAVNNGKSYSFDIGGDEHAPYIELDLSSYKVKSKVPSFELMLDANEMFQNPEVYSFEKDGYVIHSNTDPGVNKMAKNMKDMLKITSLMP